MQCRKLSQASKGKAPKTGSLVFLDPVFGTRISQIVMNFPSFGLQKQLLLQSTWNKFGHTTCSNYLRFSSMLILTTSSKFLGIYIRLQQAVSWWK